METGINKLFLPYELALLAKEKGFDEPCFGRYWHEDFKLVNIDKQFEKPDYVCLAPLYQQIIDWFREKHNIWIGISQKNDDHFEGEIDFYVGSKSKSRYQDKFTDYYEALNRAIEEAFKLI